MKAVRCRGCASRNLKTLHDFGEQPLAGHYPLAPQSAKPVDKYPLDLTQCGDCALLQVANLPPIDAVFHDDYRYSSSTVPGLVRHFESYSVWLRDRAGPTAKIFEFGCNDGVLLERLRRLGLECAGIDASDNVASLARAKGLAVMTGFLTEEWVHESRSVAAYDVVTCSNVFAHIHELGSTLAAVRLLLRDAGLFAIEVHDGDELWARNQFDTIYHEHLTYFTADTLRDLLERSGFAFVSCERTAMHGGGLRYLGRKVDQPEGVGARVRGARGLCDTDRVAPMIERCKLDLQALYEEHGPLLGYGAAGRSQMFVNFTQTAPLFARVYDDSPFRQGRYVAGTDVPIVRYEGEGGGCCIILAWNYADDIQRRIRDRFRAVVTVLPSLRSW